MATSIFTDEGLFVYLSSFLENAIDAGTSFLAQDDKEELENRLRDLASGHTDLVGAAVAVSAPGRGEEDPFLYQVRIVVYSRPKYIAAVKKDDTVQGALKEALSAVERQVREKREKLDEPRR